MRTLTQKLATELLMEWDYHNGSHHCFYEDSDDYGFVLCPADYSNLRAFIESRGFSVENWRTQISGRDLDERNFRSARHKATVTDINSYRSLREKRRSQDSEVTRQVLAERAQASEDADQDAGSNTVDSWDLQYIKEATDRHTQQLSDMWDTLASITDALERIEVALSEHSEDDDDSEECRFTPGNVIKRCLTHNHWCSASDDMCVVGALRHRAGR